MQTGKLQRLTKVFNLSGVFTRFPFPVLFMAVFTAIRIVEGSFRDESIARLLGGIVIAAYLCVSIVLAAESKGRRPSAIMQIAVFGVMTALAWFSKPLHLNIPMAIGASILLLGNAVIWRQKRDDLHVWDFTHKLWTGVGFAVVGSIIYLWGLFAIMAALRSLFGMNIEEALEYVLLPIGLGFVAPVFWLSSLPPVDESCSDLEDTPGFVSTSVAFLGSWILSPLTLIYALILLAYGVKIVIAGELPNGEVAQLTSPFLIIGTLTWLALAPPFISKNTLAKMFRKLWWPVSIPAALLLAVAVFVRVQEYGLTPERLALLGLVIWALGLALWFSFAPKLRRDIRFIPGFAAALLALGAIVSDGLSVLNQGQRLEINLGTALVVDQQGGVSSIKDMPAARKAKGALEYLMRHSGEARVKRILAAASISVDQDDFTLSNVQKTLGLDAVIMPYRGGIGNTRRFTSEKLMSVKGFENLHGPFQFYSQNKGMRYDLESHDLDIKNQDGLLIFTMQNESYEFDLIKWFNAQEQEDIAIEVSGGHKEYIKNPYIDVLDTPDRQIKLFIRDFSRRKYLNREGLDTQSYDAQFYVLTRGL